jgi:hypothetical protein
MFWRRQLVAEAAWQAQRRSPMCAPTSGAPRGMIQSGGELRWWPRLYLVRVMSTMLRRGTVWQEQLTQAA